MKYHLFILSLALIINPLSSGALDPLPVDFIDTKADKDNPSKKPSKSSASKKYADVIKDYDKIEGLFTFYWDKNKNEAYLSISPEQLKTIYLINFTRQSGDGLQFDGSSMLGEFAFYFDKMGEKIQLVRINTKFRADSGTAISKALESHVPNSIISSAKIEGKPHPETGAILVNAKHFFIYDISRVSRRTDGKYSLDKENSSYNYIDSFPMNSEIDISLNFTSKKPQYRFTLADSGSMLHKYHISISSIPSSSFSPRIADDRVGHFETIYQDYTEAFVEDPYVRYINRWNLIKAEPKLKLSKPVTPITYWIENTVPVEFRDAVRDGILAWNMAFEKI